MIKKFKVGKWYRYNGKKISRWVPEMDAVLDSKPRKVLSISGTDMDMVVFSGVGGGAWYYGHTLKDWEKVPKPKNQIDLTKPQIVKKDVLIEIWNSGKWLKRYVVIVGDCFVMTWDSGLTGKQHNFDSSKMTRYRQYKNIEKPAQEPKKVTIELTEEQAEKVRKELGLGA